MNVFACRALALILVLAGLFASGWWYGSSHTERAWQARVAAQEHQWAAWSAKQSERIATIDRERTASLKEKTDEIARLRAAVATGAVRLRVAARCPVLATPAGAGVGDGVANRPDPVAGPTGDAYLDPEAEPAYFALKEGLAQQAEQLRACQAILASERAQHR